MSANGTVQPESSVNVSPKASGVLKRLLVKEGDFVKPGQVTADLDNSTFKGNCFSLGANANAKRIQNRPNQISGGQQQRVALAKPLGTRIARTLVNHPALVLADEPTGALDSTTSEEIMNLLTELNQQGTTISIVTHDANVAARTKRTIRMVDVVIIE